MSAFIRAVRDWFGGSPAAPRPWQERAAAAALLVLAAAGLGVLVSPVRPAYQAVVWALLLVALAVASRQGWLKLVGPVLFYDLVRSARRLRFVVVRTLYAVFVSFVLFWIYLVFSARNGNWAIPSSEMSQFATYFFYTFLVIQFATVVLLTPAYVAGAVAEEKERKSLEFILATDLRNREIVLGKVVSRLLNLSLLLLAGIPILAGLQFLGGIDFVMVLAGLAVTALTMFSLAGLSMLNSVLCRQARDAIVMTYLMAVAYYLLATGAWIVLMGLTMSRLWPGLASFPSTDTWTSPVTLQDLVDWVNAGNVFFFVFKLGRGASASAVFDEELPGVLRGYAAFHLFAGLAALGWSILRLRVLALRVEVKRAAKGKGKMARARKRPRVGLYPMVWKEVFAEGGLRLNSLGRVVAGVLCLASFLPAIIILWAYFDRGFGTMSWREVGRAMNAAQMRFVGTTVACLMLLAVVVRAAGSVHSERERSTFDELLTTPLSNGEILFGKWLGAVLSVRWAWAWLGAIWLVSLVTGGVLVFALPLIFVTWVVYAAVGAGVGLWFSVGSRSTLRATVSALAVMLFVCGGHWLVSGLFCYLPLSVLTNGGGNSFEWMRDMQLGQTPPFVMGLFAIHGEEFDRPYRTDELYHWMLWSLFGVGCWAALVPFLWVMVSRRFEQVTGRAAVSRPERVMRRRPARPLKKALVVDAPPDDGQDEAILDVLPADEPGRTNGAAAPPEQPTKQAAEE